MPFQTLYKRRQAQEGVLPLSWYISDAEELSWVESINATRSLVLSKSHLRGLIIKHNPGFMPHQLVADHTILLAQGLTREEERFIVIKELMHCYFGPDGGGIFATNSQVSFENHMNEFFNNSSAIKSHQVIAEKQALWMAMAVLCPEQARRDYRVQVKDGALTYDQVAQELRIPVRRARILLSDQFEREISAILE